MKVIVNRKNSLRAQLCATTIAGVKLTLFTVKNKLQHVLVFFDLQYRDHSYKRDSSRFTPPCRLDATKSVGHSTVEVLSRLPSVITTYVHAVF